MVAPFVDHDTRVGAPRRIRGLRHATEVHRVDVDLSVALAIVTLTIVVTLLCGAVPAWHAARQDFTPFLRPTAGSGPRASCLRRALVVAQLAFSCALLIGAGLLGRSVSALMHEDHGFRPAGGRAAKVVSAARDGGSIPLISGRTLGDESRAGAPQVF